MKKSLALALAAVLLFLIGCQRIVYIEVTPAPTATPTAVITPTPTVTPTTTPIPVADEINTDSEVSGTGLSFDNDTIVVLLNSALQDGDGVSYDVSYDAGMDAFIIYTLFDGAAEAAYAAQNGTDSDYSAWVKMREAAVNLSESLRKLVETSGSEAHVCIYLLNDKNTDNVLLGILDSAVIVDAVEQP